MLESLTEDNCDMICQGDYESVLGFMFDLFPEDDPELAHDILVLDADLRRFMGLPPLGPGRSAWRGRGGATPP